MKCYIGAVDCQNYSLFKIVRFNKRNQFKLSIGLKKLK